MVLVVGVTPVCFKQFLNLIFFEQTYHAEANSFDSSTGRTHLLVRLHIKIFNYIFIY